MGLLRYLQRQLRTPRCPTAPEEKAWVERRFAWLVSRFGHDVCRKPTLTPTPEFFPHAFTGTDGEFEDLFARLCARMDLDPGRIDVHIYDEERIPDFKGVPMYESQHKGAAGLFAGRQDGRYVLGLEESMLDRPPELVATICHELGHVRLLGERHLTSKVEDHEEVTDLLTIVFGAGIFTANTAFVFQQWQTNSHQGWSASRLGYLSEPSLAYALACYAWVRGERAPGWMRFLEPGMAHLVEDSLDYLLYSEDCTLKWGSAQLSGP